MKFIDTLTHLYLKQFSEDIDDVISNSISSGIDKLFLPNISSETTKDMLDLCKKYPKTCYAMMGLHPCDVKSESMEKELLHVEEMLEKEQKLPPTSQMIRNIATDHWKSLKAWIKGSQVIASQEEAERRWEICKACPAQLSYL